MNLKRRLSHLYTNDFISIAFFSFLSLLNIVFHSRISNWWLLVLANTAVSVGIVWLANYAHNKTGFIRIMRDWDWYPFILLVFKEIYLILHPINPTDYDAALIQIDYWMFGVHPTRWLYQYAHPIFTELLQICYSLFYFLPLTLGISLYRRENKEQFNSLAFTVLYGFYLSYIGYLLVPAIGPRFTLHNFFTTEAELPGIVLTDVFRFLINLGESIPPWVTNPADLAQRDCFPSGHTQLTLVVLHLSVKFKSPTARVLFPVGIALIIATVYLRYHYVIDVIGGIAFFLLTIWSVPLIERWWKKFVGAKHLPGNI
jgi:membrane-associated phospholipid phosphatase